LGRIASLTERTTRALSFRFVGSLVDVGLSVTLSVILARLLPPEEFGLFGITVSIIAIAEMLGSCGMLRALVQRKILEPEHESTAVIFQCSSAAVMSGLLFSGAPVTARLFEMSGLEVILRLQSAVLLVHAVTLLPESRLTRRLAFDRLVVIQTSSKVLGGGIAIVLAVSGFGAAALAIGSLVSEMTRLLLLWACAPGWIPLKFEMRHLRELLSFGFGILLINISNTLAQRLDVLIVGRLIGSAGVGLYQRATQLALLPLSHTTGSMNKVLFPVMSSVQDEYDRFRRGYLATVRLSALLTFPALTALWTAADIIIPFVYGPMWEGTVSLLQIVAVAGFFRVLVNSHGLVIQARGQARAEAARQVLWLIFVVIFGLIGSRAGVSGVAIGITLAAVIFCISMTRLALPIVGVSVIDWLNTMRTGLISSISMGVAIVLLKVLFQEHLSTVLLLFTIVCAASAVYIAAVRICLSAEDIKLIESVGKVFSHRPQEVVRAILGIKLPGLDQEVQGKVGVNQVRPLR